MNTSEISKGTVSRYWVFYWTLMTGLCVVQAAWLCFTGHTIVHTDLADTQVVVFIAGSWLFGHRLWHAKRGENS